MKIGFVSDSLSKVPFDDLLDKAVALGVSGVEINTGGWSTAPHFDLQALKSSAQSRRDFMSAFTSRGLEVVSLNANGNPLHPTDKAQSECLKDTIRLAGELSIKTICAMSGLPAGAAGDKMPNWVVSSWPPETSGILNYQWNEVLLPYWQNIVQYAKECGVERIALELHGNQCVYNVPTLMRLRSEVGSTVGANLDPSHLFWKGADPLDAASALGAAIYHVHAKDTLFNSRVQATTGLLENGPLTAIPSRSSSYVTLGFGHGESWWRSFVYELKMAGYDGWLSIEHEDVLLNSIEGLQKSVTLLDRVIPTALADFEVQAI
jgi:sugar phosphate isomerase/epimerase